MLTRIARITNLVACGLFLLVPCVAAVDFGFAEPGGWHPVPDDARSLLSWTPFVTALVALLFAGMAIMRREPGIRRMGVWLASGLIALFYTVNEWDWIFPVLH